MDLSLDSDIVPLRIPSLSSLDKLLYRLGLPATRLDRNQITLSRVTRLAITWRLRPYLSRPGPFLTEYAGIRIRPNLHSQPCIASRR